jgi:hypothetical protein
VRLTRSDERLAVPSTVARAQAHPGQPRHQVEFGRSRVTQPHRIQNNAAALAHFDMRRVYRLCTWIVLRDFKPHPVGSYVKRADSLTAIEAARVRHERFHHKRSLWGKVPSDTLQAPHLFLLSEQREESTEHDVDQ